jgi:hypothetical protein
MSIDPIADFPLRGSSTEVITKALALSLRDFFKWHFEALALTSFPIIAQEAGIEALIEKHQREAFEKSLLIFNPLGVAKQMASDQMERFDHSARIAAIVMLHNAFEKCLWRLLRFGIVVDRSIALERVYQQQITIREVAATDRKILFDKLLDRWWTKQERSSLLKKWNMLVALLGSPSVLRKGMLPIETNKLEEFDEVRHDCVHRSGNKLRSFDLQEFVQRAGMAQIIWSMEIANRLGIDLNGLR